MKHLLVPVDFSDYALNACLYTLHLASEHGAKVTIFHSYHIPIIDPMMPAEFLSNLADTAEKDNREHMNKLITRLKDYKTQQHLHDVEINAQITMGFAVDEILTACEKISADMIVMGRRLTKDMNKVLIGSVTSAIIEKAKSPVLIVPENIAPETRITDVLYASEFKEEDKRTVKFLLEFNKPMKAKVHCVHVVSSQEEGITVNMQKLEQEFLAEKNANAIEFHTVANEDVTDGILSYAQSKNISILAMLTQRRTFFVKLFDRSLTKKVAFQTNVPLMVFHG